MLGVSDREERRKLPAFVLDGVTQGRSNAYIDFRLSTKNMFPDSFFYRSSDIILPSPLFSS